jgi:hypothetical protein
MDDVDLLKQAPAGPKRSAAAGAVARDAGVLWRAALRSARLASALPEGLPALLEGRRAPWCRG